MCFSDGKLSVDEFGALCRALFRDGTGSPYPLEIKKLAQMFSAFDTNQVSLHLRYGPRVLLFTL